MMIGLMNVSCYLTLLTNADCTFMSVRHFVLSPSSDLDCDVHPQTTYSMGKTMDHLENNLLA